MKNTSFVKTICATLLIISFIISLAGCQMLSLHSRDSVKLLHPESEIKSIEIVEVYGEYDYTKFEYPEQIVLVTIEDKDSFMNEFKELPFHTFWGGPQGISYHCIAIRINYINGDYDLIHSGAQSTYTVDKGFSVYEGLVTMDKKLFSDFLNAYLPENQKTK